MLHSLPQHTWNMAQQKSIIIWGLLSRYCSILFIDFSDQQILRCLGYILLAVSLVNKIEVYFQTSNFGHDNLINLSGINREFDFGLAKSLFNSHFTIVNSLFW